MSFVALRRAIIDLGNDNKRLLSKTSEHRATLEALHAKLKEPHSHTDEDVLADTTEEQHHPTTHEEWLQHFKIQGPLQTKLDKCHLLAFDLEEQLHVEQEAVQEIAKHVTQLQLQAEGVLPRKKAQNDSRLIIRDLELQLEWLEAQRVYNQLYIYIYIYIYLPCLSRVYLYLCRD